MTESHTSSGAPAPEEALAPQVATLILVRHGQTASTGKILPGRTPGLHLSEQGLEQARQVVTALEPLEKIAAIYSSPLERALETAAPLSEARALELRHDARLVECDFGSWTGREIEELVKLPAWQVIRSVPSRFRFPEGEAFTDMAARMASFLNHVGREHAGETVVAFSHADPIKAAVAFALGLHVDGMQRIIISTASLSGISLAPGESYALFVNSNPRLNLQVS